jgi:hypothetical protein
MDGFPSYRATPPATATVQALKQKESAKMGSGHRKQKQKQKK